MAAKCSAFYFLGFGVLQDVFEDVGSFWRADYCFYSVLCQNGGAHYKNQTMTQKMLTKNKVWQK